jgi:predicted fused transcriptional regulator/phosphomethylpyrimidine kinase
LDVTWLKTLVLNLQEDRLPNVLLDAGDVGQKSMLVVFGLSSAPTMSITALRSEQFKLWLS